MSAAAEGHLTTRNRDRLTPVIPPPPKPFRLPHP
jgi:hypothetical protein